MVSCFLNLNRPRAYSLTNPPDMWTNPSKQKQHGFQAGRNHPEKAHRSWIASNPIIEGLLEICCLICWSTSLAFWLPTRITRMISSTSRGIPPDLLITHISFCAFNVNVIVPVDSCCSSREGSRRTNDEGSSKKAKVRQMGKWCNVNGIGRRSSKECYQRVRGKSKRKHTHKLSWRTIWWSSSLLWYLLLLELHLAFESFEEPQWQRWKHNPTCCLRHSGSVGRCG